MVGGLGARFDEIVESRGPLCVGIDPSSESLIAAGLTDSAAGILEFGRAIIDACHERVGIVKPQIGYFERLGSAGYIVLEQIIAEARDAGLAVIADAKRGDIGTTMDGYSSAWLGDGPLHSDALTASAYQGFDALEPAFARADATGATIFVLGATSNPDAQQIQGATVEGLALPALIARRARERTGSSNSVGLVVGATRKLSASGLSETDLEHLLVLAPGFGAQGASLADLPAIFGSASPRVIPSVSRSVLVHGITSVSTAIEEHLKELGL